MKPYISFLLILLFFSSHAQSSWDCPSGKEGNIWRWDESTIDFNSLPPSLYNNSNFLTSAEATYTRCRLNGEFFFTYYAGFLSFDIDYPRDSVFILSDHSGSVASTIQTLVLPRPKHEDHYLFFYNRNGEWSLSQTGGLTCWFSEMDLTDGVDNPIQTIRDSVLFEGTTERIAATPHCNGEDWWVLTHEDGSNRFFAFLVDSNGVNTTPVVSEVGRVQSGLNASRAAYLAIDPSGQKVVMTTQEDRDTDLTLNEDGFLELFDFDNATGQVYNPILLADSLKF